MQDMAGITYASMLLVSTLLSAPAVAKGTFSSLIENDTIAGTDRHYTNGLEFSYLSEQDAVADSLRPGLAVMPGITQRDVLRYGITLGQQIFTPENTDATDPQRDERPYAAWLYLGLGFIADHGTQLDTWALNLGVVGPSAHGEQVQNEFHRLIGADQAQGWDNQLRDEVGVQLLYDHRWRNVWQRKVNRVGLDLSPHLGFSLGNVATYASGGMTLRIGTDLRADYGAPRIRPSLPGSSFFEPTVGFSWYGFVGADARAVAHNIFLDGNTSKDSLSVERKAFVLDTQAGIAIVWNRTRITYTYVLRTEEYDGQGQPDRFGSLSFSWRF
jgi:lipid A 3-O-deacylase